MQKKINWLLIAIAGLVLASCASPNRVFYDLDPQQDFAVYSTFTWISDRPMTANGEYSVSPFVERRIMQAVRKSLEGKGYSFVEGIDDAHLAVAFTVGARDKIRVRTTTATWPGDDWRWGDRYYRPALMRDEVSVNKYTEGALAIDLFDTKRRSPVWHSVGSKRLSRSELRNQDEGLKNIDEDVNKILADFPSKGR